MISSQILQSTIFWLQSHRSFNVLLVIAYFLFIVLMHHPLVMLSLAIEHAIGIGSYNAIVAVAFLLVAGSVIYFLWSHLKGTIRHRRLEVFYLASTLTMLIIHSRFMFDSNVEVIHAFEFTLLAFLIFPLTRRFGAAVLFTLPFMLFDEWYQYILLYPEWNDYFDLNDILMDTYGCGLMMTVLMIAGVKGSESISPLWKRSEFHLLLFLIITVIVAEALCFVAPYANEVCSNTLLIMNERMEPEPFFRQHPTHDIAYHVMKPGEGFAAIVLLHLFFLGLDSFRVRK